MMEANTRQKIIETAAKLFAKNGYFGVSMEEIAGELGLTKSALYYHFTGKEQLFEELMRASLKQLKVELRSAAEKSVLPSDYIFNLIKATLDFRVKRPEIILLISLGAGNDGKQPALGFVSDLYLELIKFLRELIGGIDFFRIFTYRTIFSISMTIISFALSPFLPTRQSPRQMAKDLSSLISSKVL